MTAYHATAEALKANLANLNPADRNFAKSLVDQYFKKGGLSEKQAYWIEKLASRAVNPTAAAPTLKVGVSFAGVLHLFATAAAHLKRPAIRLALDSGNEVRLSLAGAQSKNPGFVYVRVDGEYAGKISPAGEFSPFNLDDCLSEQLVGLLGALAADPAGTAAAYGKLTGACCFCSLKLTDERSTAVGYGPICADHYGLPWGEAH